MTLARPQLTLLALTLISLGITFAQHGKPKTGNENVWISLLSTALTFWLLFEGGFFK